MLVTLLFAGMIVASPSVSPLTSVANAQQEDNGSDDDREDCGLLPARGRARRRPVTSTALIVIMDLRWLSSSSNRMA